VLRAAAVAERSGVPSVTIVTTPFLAQAAVVAQGVGLPGRHRRRPRRAAGRKGERCAHDLGYTTYSLRAQVERGVLPPSYAASDDPDRPVRVFVEPAKIGIVVAGDPGRNQSKGCCNNHIQGVRVSKKVRVP
jgi:hypothetical protein